MEHKKQASETTIILAKLRLVFAYWLGLLFMTSPYIDKTHVLDTADGIIASSLLGSGLIILGGNAQIFSSKFDFSTVIGKTLSMFLDLLFALSVWVVMPMLVFFFVGFISGIYWLFFPASERLELIAALPFVIFVVALDKSRFFGYINQDFREIE